jgi:hypothetical protein
MNHIYIGEPSRLGAPIHPNDPEQDECAGAGIAADLWHASETVRYHLAQFEKLIEAGDFAAAQVEFDKIAEVTL